MDLFTIEINHQKYTFLEAVNLENKEYIAYMDNTNVYVSECVKKEDLFFKDVSDEMYRKVIEALHL